MRTILATAVSAWLVAAAPAPGQTLPPPGVPPGALLLPPFMPGPSDVEQPLPPQVLSGEPLPPGAVVGEPFAAGGVPVPPGGYPGDPFGGAGTPQPPETPEGSAPGAAVPFEDIPLPPGTVPADVLPPGLTPGPADVGPTGPAALPAVPPVVTALVRPASTFWVRLGYLNWWAKDDASPPLITLGSANDPVPGAFGQRGTLVPIAVIDDEESRGGYRVNAGYAFDPLGTDAVELDVLSLNRRNAVLAVPAQSDRVVARPYVNAVTGEESAFVVFSPNNTAGTVQAWSSNELFGVEVNYRHLFQSEPGRHWGWLAGFRGLHLDDSLLIQEDSTVTAATPGLARARTIHRYDQFGSQNTFLGPQAGLDFDWVWWRFVFNVYGKLALGVASQSVSIRGGTVGSDAAGTVFGPADVGFLAQPGNVGDYGRGRFSALSEVGLNFTFHLNEYWRFSCGYSCLNWSDVARAGHQASRVLNATGPSVNALPGALVGPAQPRFVFQDTDYWAQGLNLALEFRY